MSLHQAFLTASAPSDSLLSLCLGMDMEERTRQMKLKMNKYKQGAGSDSRLEQDYHKVNMSRYAGCMLQHSRVTEKYIYLHYTVCMAALCKGHMVHFASSQACAHVHINIILRMYMDVCIVYTHPQVELHKHHKTGNHSTQFKGGFSPLSEFYLLFFLGQFTQITKT